MTSPLLCVPCVGLLVLTTWLTQPTMPQQPAAATNPATTPVARTDQSILARQSEVLTRAKEAAPSTVVFLGDSITQGFEGAGKTAWDTHIAPWGALNLGVSGDRTEHVLWRLQQAPLTRLQPRSVVLLIGTNNLGHGTSTAEQTLEGLWAVIRTIRTQVPDARLFVHEIFPRGERFQPMRGEIAQINQVLRAHQGSDYTCLNTGDQWVRKDGTISAEIMPDYLHLSPQGYEQWAQDLKAKLTPKAGR